ncbi:hypothetical protein PAPYR_12025 [Paratrimastix pyriformis]|uniref:Uncharacterized protein n=1 Tax=Paratrimastix pyriformis TaxID=342808 RepID=A0ABQ8U2J8_9EUKA|nr:hypothetical protein PAPYR_12025 [Paratrimastix pyriformis]
MAARWVHELVSRFAKRVLQDGRILACQWAIGYTTTSGVQDQFETAVRKLVTKAWRLVASKASFHLPGCVSEPPGEEGAYEIRSVYLLRKFQERPSLVRHSAIGHLYRPSYISVTLSLPCRDFDARQTCIRGPNISGHPNPRRHGPALTVKATSLHSAAITQPT